MLLAVAYRAGQAPGAVVAALGDAARAARSERLAPAPLSAAEAAVLCGGDVTPELYALSGGNPFYLQQLARAPPDAGATAPLGQGGTDIPAAVAAALAGELDALPAEARRVLEAAAVAGEPFEPDLVAEVAGLGEDGTLTALDALLELALIRPTSVAAPLRLPAPGDPPRRLRGRSRRLAAASACPRGGRTRAARRRAGGARPSRRARRPARRSRRRRPAGRGCRARLRTGAGERRALPRERAPAAPGRGRRRPTGGSSCCSRGPTRCSARGSSTPPMRCSPRRWGSFRATRGNSARC